MPDNFFEFGSHRIPVTEENCKRLVRLHTAGRKATQKNIAEAIGVKEPELSNFMNDRLRVDFAHRMMEKLHQYFSSPDRAHLLQRLIDDLKDINVHQSKILQSLSKTRELANGVIAFLGCNNENNAKLSKDGIQSFYYCYKFSQRFTKSDNRRRIVKSIVRIKYQAGGNVFLFEDRQFNIKKVKERDITHGIVLFNGNGLFLLGREIDENQPRLFWLSPGPKAAAPDEDEETVQHLTGFCFEGYAKFDNPLGRRPGSFFSPIGLCRISDVELKILGDQGAAAGGIIENRWPFPLMGDDLLWQVLSDHAKIIDEVDLDADHPISKHFLSADWIDSNELGKG